MSIHTHIVLCMCSRSFFKRYVSVIGWFRLCLGNEFWSPRMRINSNLTVKIFLYTSRRLNGMSWGLSDLWVCDSKRLLFLLFHLDYVSCSLVVTGVLSFPVRRLNIHYPIKKEIFLTLLGAFLKTQGNILKVEFLIVKSPSGV